VPRATCEVGSATCEVREPARKQVNGTILRIERFAIHDGPGIRTTVFLKGCPLRCAWCHSPESQSPRPEFMPPPERCIACGRCVPACPQHAIPGPGAPTHMEICRVCGTCVDVCPTGARLLVGSDMTVEELVDALERDRIFYDESHGGVTFSGGEPLLQPAFLTAMVDECHARGMHVAVDTCGFADPAAVERIWPDLVLFDVKAVDEDLHRSITGASNTLILANLARFARRAQPMVVRFPLIPGLTDSDENVHAVGRLVSSLQIHRVDVLPYHRAGISKYERLGRPYPLPFTEPPAEDRIRHVVELLTPYRLSVQVGG
jgi:pyruvate formate lyase activating enzyme